MEQESLVNSEAAVVTRLLEFVLCHLAKELAEIRSALEGLRTQGEKIMATQQEFTAVIAKINDATNRMATALNGVETKLQALKDQVDNMGLTQEQESTILSGLDSAATVIHAQADKATAIASNPDQPVPLGV